LGIQKARFNIKLDNVFFLEVDLIESVDEMSEFTYMYMATICSSKMYIRSPPKKQN
jgi:hypothetical protein